jgi:hypothetical protein
VIGLLAVTVLYAFAPPHAWDSMTYHLIAPTRYLAEARIALHADNFFMGLAQFTEMLYAVTISVFGRAMAAAPVHFGIGVLSLIAVMGVARRYLGVASAWMAALLLMSSYSLWALFGWAYVDLTVMALSAASIITVLRWRETNQAGWLILTGCLIGFAVSTKYVAGGLAMAMLLFVVIKQPRSWLKNGAILGGGALACFALWMVKGLFLYGNPIYPYIFGGLMWDSTRMASFNQVDANLIAAGQALQLPILPIAATLFGRHNGQGFSFTSGGWLLTVPFLLPIVWHRIPLEMRRRLRDVVLLAVPMLLFWMFTAATTGIGIQTRLALMLFPCAAVLGAAVFHGLDQLPRKPIYVGFMVRALFIFTLFFQLADIARAVITDKIVPYSLGMIEESEYLYTQMGAHYPALSELAARVPEGSQVRMMWEPRSFYCASNVRCLPDVMFDHWRREYAAAGDAESVFAEYANAGDDFLLFYATLYELDSQSSENAEANAVFLPALEQFMTPIWSDGFYTLYEWK